MHSALLVLSLWRVFSITLSSQTDMPSLTTVTLDKKWAFKEKKTLHTKSPSPSPPSFLDITPALRYYLYSPLSCTHSSSSIPHILKTTTSHITPKTPPISPTLPKPTIHLQMGKKGKGNYGDDYRPHPVKKPKRKYNDQKETHVRGYKEVFHTFIS